jgi:hypothetical protein
MSVLSLLTSLGCRGADRAPTDSARGSAGGTRSATADSAAGFTDRAWIRSDSTGMPGVMRIFLSNGTLLMDSCGETYRLAKWERRAGGQISWNEDGTEIRATVLSLNDRDLTLRLDLQSGADEQHYRRADAPYVCPEMRR